MPPKITDVLNKFSTLRTELDERFQVLRDNLQKGFKEREEQERFDVSITELPDEMDLSTYIEGH